MNRLRVIVTIAACASLFAMTAAKAQSPTAATFSDRVKASLQAQQETDLIPPDRRSVPVTGASEPVDAGGTAPQATDTSSEPYNAGHDVTSGFVAAGAALLSAVLILLILIMVATSRHHEQS